LETDISKFKIAVLTGGIGSEREISLQTGNFVAEALKKAGLDVILSDVTPDEVAILDDKDIDVFFLALHGQFGEDGQLQRILEEKNLTYTGSGSAASKLAFDKMACKTVFDQASILTPKAVEFDQDSDHEEIKAKLSQLGGKFVVKPIRQGSSVGITIVQNPDQVIAIAEKTLAEFSDCMIEQYIAGREITVGILGSMALPIIEIQAKNGFYDYHAKYIDDKTEFLFDSINDAELAGSIQATAVKCFDCLGCRDFARVDFILDQDNKAYVLEVNTIPGLTSHSLVPLAVAKAKISMSELCTRIITSAMAEKSQLSETL
jgi:D-alanine-D-alanine ligase